ncbi:hypothetical protein CYLTODRAFT_410917 [Cylindrobasidium torrendii FP15055 ss-10]|uniref:Uncharacterized protein n=1 Tax=Cylindrobasidium torrendii FP15055 ss-10 TaxID=1314674 RepID=A0A0D7BC16_9AGAR|nr:hypothetical protein CYLTODRAFT_410917 [Cylindrobasidium torrendii FP15055 ss-10]
MSFSDDNDWMAFLLEAEELRSESLTTDLQPAPVGFPNERPVHHTSSAYAPGSLNVDAYGSGNDFGARMHGLQPFEPTTAPQHSAQSGPLSPHLVISSALDVDTEESAVPLAFYAIASEPSDVSGVYAPPTDAANATASLTSSYDTWPQTLSVDLTQNPLSGAIYQNTLWPTGTASQISSLSGSSPSPSLFSPSTSTVGDGRTMDWAPTFQQLVLSSGARLAERNIGRPTPLHKAYSCNVCHGTFTRRDAASHIRCKDGWIPEK